MTFDNKLQLFRPTMIRFLYSSILCEKASAFTECCPHCCHLQKNTGRCDRSRPVSQTCVAGYWKVVGIYFVA